MDLDGAKDGTQVVFAEHDVTGRKLLAHQLRESGDFVLGNGRAGVGKVTGTVQGALSPVPFLLQFADALAKRIVHIGESVLDELLETPQALVGILGLVLQVGDPGVDGTGAFSLARNKVFEKGSEAVRAQQLAVEGIHNEIVQ